MVNLSESMAQLPGPTLSNRNNYARDLQISSRGFGPEAELAWRSGAVSGEFALEWRAQARTPVNDLN